ncbi:hypothetical protein [Georgenia sp. SUBG003]|uniref:hypothetical protein n=1 Tax=Georgenia sp. SUBG003 TaxID=1497974 RepID=UPI003AB28A71
MLGPVAEQVGERSTDELCRTTPRCGRSPSSSTPPARPTWSSRAASSSCCGRSSPRSSSPTSGSWSLPWAGSAVVVAFSLVGWRAPTRWPWFGIRVNTLANSAHSLRLPRRPPAALGSLHGGARDGGVDVGREHHDQQGGEAARRPWDGARHEQADRPGQLEHAGDGDQQAGVRGRTGGTMLMSSARIPTKWLVPVITNMAASPPRTPEARTTVERRRRTPPRGVPA